jgi:hypothetical protein
VCGSRVVSGSYDNTCRVGVLLLLYSFFLSFGVSSLAFLESVTLFIQARLAVLFLWASGVFIQRPFF